MGKIDLHQICFTKKDMKCISEEEAIFLLQAGGLIHEVISLQKFMRMSSHVVDNPIQRTAENAQALYFFRLLAGTLLEGWKVIQHRKYKTIIAEYKFKLDPISKSAFETLENY